MATPLIIGPDEEAKFAALSKYANEHTIYMPDVMKLIATKAGERKHLDRMSDYTISLPFGYTVTFDIEIGHPIGTCRHLSVAAPLKGRVPSPPAVWMIAEYFGFKGGYSNCRVWDEDIDDGRITINVVQPLKAS